MSSIPTELAFIVGDDVADRAAHTAARGLRLAEDGSEYVEQPPTEPAPEPGLPPVDDEEEQEDAAAGPAAVAASRAGARIAHTAAAMDPATALL
ncbi:MAG: hypothetical protein E7Z94_06750 [Actinomyces ruminicola]|nr:hypothetical protein [Actinomyces ruminicola]